MHFLLEHILIGRNEKILAIVAPSVYRFATFRCEDPSCDQMPIVFQCDNKSEVRTPKNFYGGWGGGGCGAEWPARGPPGRSSRRNPLARGPNKLLAGAQKIAATLLSQLYTRLNDLKFEIPKTFWEGAHRAPSSDPLPTLSRASPSIRASPDSDPPTFEAWLRPCNLFVTLMYPKRTYRASLSNIDRHQYDVGLHSWSCMGTINHPHSRPAHSFVPITAATAVILPVA